MDFSRYRHLDHPPSQRAPLPSHGEPTPDLTPRLSWPSFAAGAVFTLVVFVMARLALGAA